MENPERKTAHMGIQHSRDLRIVMENKNTVAFYTFSAIQKPDHRIGQGL